jgi:hypothetical protein
MKGALKKIKLKKNHNYSIFKINVTFKMYFLKFKISLSKLFLNYLSGKLGIFDNKK